MKFRIPVLMLICLFPALASAAEITVTPGSAGAPQTIQEALDMAQAGDTVMVPAGTYRENLTMKSGVVLMGVDGPRNTIIDGDGDICVNCEECATGTRITGFSLVNGGGYTGCGVRVFLNSDVEIDHNIIRDNHADFEAAGVLVQNHSTGLIHDNVFLGNTAVKTAAVSVIISSNADIRRNVFKRNRSDVLAAAIGVNDSDATIAHNMFTDNVSGSVGGTVDIAAGATAEVSNNTFLRNRADAGGSCISLNTYYHYVRVFNNLAAYNTGTSAMDFMSCQIIGCNIIWESGTGYDGPCVADLENNMQVDPLLCDPNGDLGQVAAESPCFSEVCGFIGANPQAGCSMPGNKALPREATTWGSLKASYR